MINAGYIDPKSLGGLPKAQVGKSVFKAPAVPAYAQGRDQLRPQQFIDVKKYQDNRSQEIVDQIRNNKSIISQGYRETPQEREYRIRQNTQYQQLHPYSNINEQGTLSRSQSDRNMQGIPEAHSRAYYNDQGLDKAMTSLEAAGYITGAGELLGAAAPIMKEAVKDAGRYLTEETALKNTYKINPYALKQNSETFLYRTQPKGFNFEVNNLKSLENKLASGESLTDAEKASLNYFQTDPRAKIHQELYGRWFFDDPKRLKPYIEDNLKRGDTEILRTKLLKNEADLYNVKNNINASLVGNPDIEYVLPYDVIKNAEKFSSSNIDNILKQHPKPNWLTGYRYKEVPKPTSTQTITRGPINYWEEPKFAERNPSFNPEKYANKISQKVNLEDLPDNLKPFMERDLTRDQWKAFNSEQRRLRTNYGLGYDKYDYGGQPCYECGGMYPNGGPIVDPMGQWAHPGQVTRIPGSKITMGPDPNTGRPITYPVLGIGSNGQKQMMYPNQEYSFGGADHVDEYPMMANGGGLLSKKVSCSNCGWSWEAVDGGSDPMTCHKCGGIAEMKNGGYVVTRSHDRKGKTHKVTGPDGTVKYFGDSKLGQHPGDPARKAAFYARHKHNLDNNPFFRAFARKTWAEGGQTNDDREMLSGVADILRRINDTSNRKEVANYMMDNFRDEDVSFEPNKFLKSANVFDKGGEMIRRADGSYSRRGLWDNIRANIGSGKEPTKEMLKQEHKINSMRTGGSLPKAQLGEGWVQRAANAEYSCRANPRQEERAARAAANDAIETTSGGRKDPDRDAKNARWKAQGSQWEIQGINKQDFNNAFNDSSRMGNSFMNPDNLRFFDPNTRKIKPEFEQYKNSFAPRLGYYEQVPELQLGQRPTVNQILQHHLAQPQGIEGYRQLIKNDYSGYPSPFIPPVKQRGGEQARYQAYKDSLSLYNRGNEEEKFYRAHGFDPSITHEFPFSKMTSYVNTSENNNVHQNKIKPVSAVGETNDPRHPNYYRAQWFKYKKPEVVVPEPQAPQMQRMPNAQMDLIPYNTKPQVSNIVMRAPSYNTSNYSPYKVDYRDPNSGKYIQKSFNSDKEGTIFMDDMRNPSNPNWNNYGNVSGYYDHSQNNKFQVGGQQCPPGYSKNLYTGECQKMQNIPQGYMENRPSFSQGTEPNPYMNAPERTDHNDSYMLNKIERENEQMYRDRDSRAENVFEFFDPTGLSNWDDVSRTFKNPNSSGWDRGFAVASALPIVGKLGKAAKVAQVANKGNRFSRIVKPIGRAIGNTLDVVSGARPMRYFDNAINPLGRAFGTLSEQAVKEMPNKYLRGAAGIGSDFNQSRRFWDGMTGTYNTIDNQIMNR